MKATVDLRSMQRKLWLMGVFKIPMIGYVRPKLLELNDTSAKVKIRLRRKTRNHLKSMYFGVLMVGADMVAGLHAFYYGEQSERRMSFVFKSVKADFLMRAETDVYFESSQGTLIREVVNKALETGERVHQDVEVVAKDTHGNVVARFTLTISIRFK